MSGREMFIEIKNWKKYQADFKGRREWIKDYIDKENDREFCELKAAQRYIYDALRRFRGRGKLPPLDLDFLARKMDLDRDDRKLLGRAIERLVELKLVY